MRGFLCDGEGTVLRELLVPLAVFLRERKPEGIGELARLAEQYLEAHANSKTTVKKSEKEGFSSSSAFSHHIRSQRLRVFVELVQARRLASLVENLVICLRIAFMIRRN